MLFAIRLTVMNGDEAGLDALDAIAVRVEDDVHEAVLADADLLPATRWYQTSRPDRRKLLEGIAGASLHRSPRVQGPHLRRVEVHDSASAAVGRSLATASLLVLAENEFSDGALVRAAIRTLAQQATIDLCFGDPSRLDPPALAIESRGGHGELAKLIDTRVAEAAARNRPARLLVVADSDGEWPGDAKDHVLAIHVQCAEAGVPCPPLNKRTAENYLPDGALNAWVAPVANTAARLAVKALQSLSPEQRDHVHMDRPSKEPWDATKAKVSALFWGVPDADRETLRLAQLKGHGETMLILILEQHGAALDRADLLARDHGGDLVGLVRQIEDEL